MPKNNSVHVVPHAEGWAVKMEGAVDASSVHSRQDDAIQAAMDLARKEEMNLIVHREDGQFGEVLNYEDIRSAGDERSMAHQGERAAMATPLLDNPNDRSRESGAAEHPSVVDLLPVRSRVSWGAIAAGLVTAFTVYVLLGALGAAVGLSASQSVGGERLAAGAAIWALLSMLIALFLGGYIVSRVTTGESTGEAVLYGLLLWGTLGALLVALPGSGMNDPGFGGVLSRSRAPVTTTSPAYTPAMFQQAGLEVSEAQLANLEEARQAAMGRVDATRAAWWTFAGLILSLLSSIAGAVLGAGPELVFERIRTLRRGETPVTGSAVGLARDRAPA